MERYGKVIECHDDYALVRLRKHIACAGCGRCGGILGGPETKDQLVEVSNPIGAEVGQHVKVESDPRQMLFVAFMLYLVPVLVFIGGVLGGAYLYTFLGFSDSSEFFGFVAGLALMAFVFYLLRRWDRSVSKSGRYRPVVSSIVENLDQELDLETGSENK
ncbi:MAG: SoxR reducing system RseC family protein [Dethiobacteria bacterium]|jgi:sigma-E factor negative regulatory protein RseC|nr:SoxR reducing system RseC family protein [Bacillota bacterium]